MLNLVFECIIPSNRENFISNVKQVCPDMQGFKERSGGVALDVVCTFSSACYVYMCYDQSFQTDPQKAGAIQALADLPLLPTHWQDFFRNLS